MKITQYSNENVIKKEIHWLFSLQKFILIYWNFTEYNFCIWTENIKASEQYHVTERIQVSVEKSSQFKIGNLLMFIRLWPYLSQLYKGNYTYAKWLVNLYNNIPSVCTKKSCRGKNCQYLECSWDNSLKNLPIPFLRCRKLSVHFLIRNCSFSDPLLNFSLRNSTVMNVKAEAGTYHTTLGMLPLNNPFAPSITHVLWMQWNQPLYLHYHS